MDEVQSGFGRAGFWFAFEESGVKLKSEIMLITKARFVLDESGWKSLFLLF